MNWLITGGCGFIGTNLIKELLSLKANKIRIVDNLSVGTKDDLLKVCNFQEISAVDFKEQKVLAVYNNDTQVELIVGDIMDEDLALKSSEGIDVIVHLAANTGVGPSVENPRLDCMLNVIGTFNYLEGARQNKVPRFIFASSGAPAGEVEPPIHEELPPHPVSPYGASKLAGEGYCSAYNKTFGIDTISLRFGNVYGPGSLHKSSVVAKFIRKALSRETLEIYGDGSQTRDFIYIDDLIKAVLLASQKDGIGGEAFQIATNRETTVGEMSELLIEILNEKGLKDIHLINSESRLGDVSRNYSDTSKAKNRLNWTTQINLDEGLRKTVDFFLKKNG